MDPFIQKSNFLLSDTVRYYAYLPPGSNLQNKIVAIKNPYMPGEVIFRRVIAVQGQWVQRMDDGGIIQVPSNHIWVECENNENRNYDSLTELAGPISVRFVIGECKSIIWPIWRRTSFQDMYKFSALIKPPSQHSAVYDKDEMFSRYGIY